MKAWHVHDGDPYESSLLVIAPTAGRAKYMAFKHGTWEYDEFIYTRAVRAPQWDGVSNNEAVFDTNEELPDGAPKFYRDEEEWA